MDCEESSDGASVGVPSLECSGGSESDPLSMSLMNIESDPSSFSNPISESVSGNGSSVIDTSSSVSNGPRLIKPPLPEFIIIPGSDVDSVDSSLYPLPSASPISNKSDSCCKPPIPEYITIPETDLSLSDNFSSNCNSHLNKITSNVTSMNSPVIDGYDEKSVDVYSGKLTANNSDDENRTNLLTNPAAREFNIDSDDLQKIKGDAIGDTLYSERWTLQILMKITQFSDEMWCDDFESEICALWDMTQDKDVVMFLLKQDIITIIKDILGITQRSRFSEVLVGLLGNLCCIKEGRDSLLNRTEMLDFLMTNIVIEKPETELLIQFFRLIHALAWDLVTGSSPAGDWLEKQLCSSYLVPCITFFLRSSTSEELLRVVLEFLNTLCGLELSDKDFSQYFSTLQEFVGGMIECWNELFSSWTPDENFPNKQLYKTASYWASVLCSLTSHERGREHLCQCAFDLGEICKKIVARSDDCIDNILISAVCLLDTIMTEYFDKSTFERILRILNLLYKETDVINKRADSFSDDNLDELLIDGIENYCYSVNTKLLRPERSWALRDLSQNYVNVFRQAVNKRELLFNSGRGR